MMSKQGRTLRKLFVAVLIVMAFTGFGQMPIYNRYYLSDIPGLGWSANFYLTHTIHYLGAIFLVGLLSYVILDYFLTGKGEYGLTRSAYVRIALLSGIVLTGIFRVLKNLPDVSFSPGFTLFFDLAHLAFTMLYLMAAMTFLIMQSGWTESA